MPHLNFGRNNGKPAAVTSCVLWDEGGKLRLWSGQLESWGESPPAPNPHPQMMPLHSLWSNNKHIGQKNKP